MVHGTKLLTCSLALCWTTPSAFSVTMSWHGLGRVLSRDCSQQAMFMRLLICDTFCSVQPSNAILASFAFSCTTIHLLAMFKGAWRVYSAVCCPHWRTAAQLSHNFRLFELETRTNTNSVFQDYSNTVWDPQEIQDHVVWSVDAGSFLLWKLVLSNVNKAQFTSYGLKMPGSYPSSPSF